MEKITNESLGATHTGSLKENKKKNIKGITLVALVVTIIILLILAGISISALTQTGLFGKVKQAKEKYEKMVFFCEKYKMPYMVVDTSNLTPDQTVELIMKRIEGRA